MPRIIWVGDSPTVSTGFARCTRAVCGELHTVGWDVHVLGINYFADPHDYPYRIWPCRQPLDGGYDAFGVGRLPILMDRLKPDVVVLLNDPWNIAEYFRYTRRYGLESSPPVVGWIAVDSKNQDGRPLNDLAHVVTWTQFAIDELRAGGYEGTTSIVPLAVDTHLFYPRDRAISRSHVCPEGLPDDAFIVGVVGRLQPRKRVDLAIAYFAEWVCHYDIHNAWLYIHAAPTGDRGCNVRSLVKYHGLAGKVILAEPAIEHGVSESTMPDVYNSFDVCLTTTQGEGWGLTTMEAMACGIPCVVPAWSALGEWARDAAVQIPCTSTALNAPLNSLAYTIGGVSDKNATVEALQSLYESATMRSDYKRLGLALTARPEYQWTQVGRSFRGALERYLDAQPSPVPDAAEVVEIVEVVEVAAHAAA